MSYSWLLIKPNMFEFFLSIVELDGISVSTLSLRTVANLNSINLSLGGSISWSVSLNKLIVFLSSTIFKFSILFNL